MSLKIVVLAKQVPDTRSVGKDAMNADGTINRSALPAIFNPEDLNALEQALRLKDTHPGSTVTMLTMGPGRAAEIIREGLYRGADNGYLLTDRAFAGADTLATSYAEIRLAPSDLRRGNRRSERQVYPRETPHRRRCGNRRRPAPHRIDRERKRSPLPPAQRQISDEIQTCLGRTRKSSHHQRRSRTALRGLVRETSVPEHHRMERSRRERRHKVKKIENIIFQAKESKTLTGSDADVENLIVELLANHTIG